MFYLWYDNGTGYFDCASSHDTLEEAVKAAGEGPQTRQHITNDKVGFNIVWRNYGAGQTACANLVYFIDAACYGYTMQGGPPPLYDELKAASLGDLEPIKKALGLDRCPTCDDTGKRAPECTRDGRCLCSGRGCPECGG